MTNERIRIHADQIRLDEHPYENKLTGMTTYQQMLLDDPDTHMIVKLIRYPKGSVTPLHDHHCAHGMYVLSGTLYTDAGDFEPGSFVWFPEGDQMVHGGKDEDAVCLFVTNKAFDIHFLNLT